jgi:hypothetical protein
LVNIVPALMPSRSKLQRKVQLFVITTKTRWEELHSGYQALAANLS